MRTNQATFPIATMCRVLAVSASGYYRWRRRPLSARSLDDAALTERIRAAHTASKGTYGAPRIHAELAAQGVRIGKKRVARLMRACGLAGVSRRRGVVTTRREGSRQAPDLAWFDRVHRGLAVRAAVAVAQKSGAQAASLGPQAMRRTRCAHFPLPSRSSVAT